MNIILYIPLESDDIFIAGVYLLARPIADESFAIF